MLYGTEFIYEELLGLKFKISPFSFFQTNTASAELLYSKAREYVGDTKDKVIFDLYSGTGTIAQMLSAVARKVVGVEIVSEAVDAARANAELNDLDNCEFIAGDVLKVIDSITDKPDGCRPPGGSPPWGRTPAADSRSAPPTCGRRTACRSPAPTQRGCRCSARL